MKVKKRQPFTQRYFYYLNIYNCTKYDYLIFFKRKNFYEQSNNHSYCAVKNFCYLLTLKRIIKKTPPGIKSFLIYYFVFIRVNFHLLKKFLFIRFIVKKKKKKILNYSYWQL
ncbi:hypothetical protein RhiirC2_459722 [Rhizophagus irregularis]|uniref:Uncharacterized protein n=1 Tax=Rhizophagus irregularis TaxID=588596 RepID=A0A2N1N9G8_9GLOM|nr:hypothetical protein RhiirC2_459722 [Rhizophagus irregularis]